jgi:predicted PurR-regulated permease PerM
MPATSDRGSRGWPPVTYWIRVTVAVLAVLALARILLAIGWVLVLILVSLVLALGFQPAVESLTRRGVSRGWAVALGLISGVVLFGLFLWLVVPDVIAEVGNLVRQGPQLLARAQETFPFLGDLDRRFDLEAKLEEAAGRLPETVLGLVGSFGSLVFGSLTVLILTIYFTVSMPRMRNAVSGLLHREDRQEFEEIVDESIQRVGAYVLGALVVSAIAGTTSFIFFLLVGVPFAAALAFLVAVLGLIPTVGALLAAVLASLVALFAGIPEAIGTAAYFLVYQQVENYLIQPRVMSTAIDMSAALVIVAVLIGGALLGVVGALLALPVAAIVKVVLHELFVEDRRAEVEAAEGQDSASKPG